MKRRFESVYILRGISVTFIVLLYHGYLALVNFRYPIFETILIRIAYLGTAIFITFSGTSTFLFINNKVKLAVSKKEIIFNLIKRAIFIFTIPTCISILYWFIMGGKIISINYLLYWNVFQLIAVCMIAFFFIPFLRIKVRIFLYFTLFILIFLISHLILFYNIELLLFSTYGSEGDFPFFPYSNYILFGLFLGDLLENLPEEKYYRYLILIFIICIIGIINWILWVREIEYLYIESVVWSLSTLVMALSFFYYIVDRKNYNFKLKKNLVDFGKYTFSMFYIASFLIFTVEIILFLFFRDIYLRGFLLYEFLIIFGIFCVIIYLISLLWEKFEYKYGMEWFLRKFAEFSIMKKKEIEKESL